MPFLAQNSCPVDAATGERKIASRMVENAEVSQGK
jgi:hypothetical protein